MLEFDEGTLSRLQSPTVEIADKLFLIARYIEEKYDFLTPPNYWEDRFAGMVAKEKIFYRVWLWLCYAESENLVSPVVEFDNVYSPDIRNRLLASLKSKQNDRGPMDSYFSSNGQGGRLLLDWGISRLDTNYKPV